MIPFVVLSLLVHLLFRLLIELLDCPKIYGCDSLLFSPLCSLVLGLPLFCVVHLDIEHIKEMVSKFFCLQEILWTDFFYFYDGVLI